MYVLLFIYSFVVGIFTYLILKMDFITYLMFAVIIELFIFLAFKKFSFPFRPFERINFNLAMLAGYFYSALAYGLVNFVPFNF